MWLKFRVHCLAEGNAGLPSRRTPAMVNMRSQGTHVQLPSTKAQLRDDATGYSLVYGCNYQAYVHCLHPAVHHMLKVYLRAVKQLTKKSNVPESEKQKPQSHIIIIKSIIIILHVWHVENSKRNQADLRYITSTSKNFPPLYLNSNLLLIYLNFWGTR
jgi:hypothetical protein